MYCVLCRVDNTDEVRTHWGQTIAGGPWQEADYVLDGLSLCSWHFNRQVEKSDILDRLLERL